MNFLAPLLVGAGGSLLDKLTNKKTKVSQISNLTGSQGDVLSQMMQSLGPLPKTAQNPLYQQGSNLISTMLQGGRNEGLERPLMRQFQEETLPQIGERFSGSSGSSALNQALARAAENLLGDIGTMRAQNQQSALQQALGYAQIPFQEYNQIAGLGLGRQAFNTAQKPPNQGFLGGVLGGIGPALGQRFSGSIMDSLGLGESDSFDKAFQGDWYDTRWNYKTGAPGGYRGSGTGPQVGGY